MLFAMYIPSSEKAVQALPGQCLVVGVLALALYAYARQRHEMTPSILSLAAGFLGGIAGGLIFEEDVIAFIELWKSAVAGSIGLTLGWLALEMVGLFCSHSATQAKSLSNTNEADGNPIDPSLS